MHGVELGGTARKYMFLPGESLPMRIGKQSAEAVVVMMLAERQEERRAEELRERTSFDLERGTRRRLKHEIIATAAMIVVTGRRGRVDPAGSKPEPIVPLSARRRDRRSVIDCNGNGIGNSFVAGKHAERMAAGS
jgi:hypothetical protein